MELQDIKVGMRVKVVSLTFDNVPKMIETMGNVYTVKEIDDSPVPIGLDVPGATGMCGLFWYFAEDLEA